MPTQTFSKAAIPAQGLEVSASPGKGLTRVHLDLAQDGVALSLVGAASAALPSGNRHVVRLTPGKDGVALAMVGAASAAKS